MIAIDSTIISDDLFRIRFACHLQRCHGACCVAGDAGAPLEESEISLLEDHLEDIIPFMTDRGQETIRQGGVFDYDMQGNFVTPLVNDGECAYALFESGIAFCAIEKAGESGKIPFGKPLSCHLYPVRITKYENFEAVNYQKWGICKPALKQGNKTGMPLYRFLKKALIRKYGEAWYSRLESEIEKRLESDR